MSRPGVRVRVKVRERVKVKDSVKVKVRVGVRVMVRVRVWSRVGRVLRPRVGGRPGVRVSGSGPEVRMWERRGGGDRPGCVGGVGCRRVSGSKKSQCICFDFA